MKNLKNIIMVRTEGLIPGEPTSIEKRYDISSLTWYCPKSSKCDPQTLRIENQVHGILDIGFRDDEQNDKAGNISENTSLMRRDKASDGGHLFK